MQAFSHWFEYDEDKHTWPTAKTNPEHKEMTQWHFDIPALCWGLIPTPSARITSANLDFSKYKTYGTITSKIKIVYINLYLVDRSISETHCIFIQNFLNYYKCKRKNFHVHDSKHNSRDMLTVNWKGFKGIAKNHQKFIKL